MNRVRASEVAVALLRQTASEVDEMVCRSLSDATRYPPRDPQRLACLNLASTGEFLRRHYADAATALEVQP